MKPEVIEGMWEEVSQRAEELAGRRVRVTVLDDAPLRKTSGDDRAGESTSPVADPILGIFGDDPQLLDEVVEEAMQIREERPWRLPAGE